MHNVFPCTASNIGVKHVLYSLRHVISLIRSENEGEPSCLWRDGHQISDCRGIRPETEEKHIIDYSRVPTNQHALIGNGGTIRCHSQTWGPHNSRDAIGNLLPCGPRCPRSSVSKAILDERRQCLYLFCRKRLRADDAQPAHYAVFACHSTYELSRSEPGNAAIFTHEHLPYTHSIHSWQDPLCQSVGSTVWESRTSSPNPTSSPWKGGVCQRTLIPAFTRVLHKFPLQSWMRWSLKNTSLHCISKIQTGWSRGVEMFGRKGRYRGVMSE